MTDEETRREAAARLRRAAWASGADQLTEAVLTAIADSIEPGPPAIDMDGTGYMLDARALRMAREIVGDTDQSTPDTADQATCRAFGYTEEAS